MKLADISNKIIEQFYLISKNIKYISLDKKGEIEFEVVVNYFDDAILPLGKERVNIMLTLKRHDYEMNQIRRLNYNKKIECWELLICEHSLLSKHLDKETALEIKNELKEKFNILCEVEILD